VYTEPYCLYALCSIICQHILFCVHLCVIGDCIRCEFDFSHKNVILLIILFFSIWYLPSSCTSWYSLKIEGLIPFLKRKLPTCIPYFHPPSPEEKGTVHTISRQCLCHIWQTAVPGLLFRMPRWLELEPYEPPHYISGPRIHCKFGAFLRAVFHICTQLTA
jgi:hypothetical protein